MFIRWWRIFGFKTEKEKPDAISAVYGGLAIGLLIFGIFSLTLHNEMELDPDAKDWYENCTTDFATDVVAEDEEFEPCVVQHHYSNPGWIRGLVSFIAAYLFACMAWYDFYPRRMEKCSGD